MIKIAVVGVGRMGSRHAKNLKRFVKNAELVCICDHDTQKTDKLKKSLSCKGYYDFDEMLEKETLDAVVIATPHYSHVDLAKKCIEKNINVLCEKPISVTTLAAKELIDTYKESNTICSMMFNQRTNNMYIKAKELIDSGKLGKIQRINFTITDWYRAQFYYNMGGWRASYKGEGGGTLINQCVHQLDILQYLCGMPSVIRSFNKTKGRRITTENDVTAIMRWDDYDCVFTASTHEVPGTNRLEIAFEKGKLVIGKRVMKAYFLKMSEEEINKRAKRDYGNKKDKKAKVRYYSYGLLRLIKDGLFGQQCRILQNFVDALTLKDKNMLIAPLEEGIKALTLINAMNLSSWQNEDVTLPFDDEKYVELLDSKIQEERK